MPIDRITYQDILREWKQNRFRSVYLFSGTETLLKAEAVETLGQLFLGADNQEVNWDRFDGKTAQAMDVATVWQTRAFFGGRRLSVFRRFYRWAVRESLCAADPTVRMDAPRQRMRLPGTLHDAARIARQITHGGVELGQRHPHG